MTQKDPWPIVKLRAFFGGSIRDIVKKNGRFYSVWAVSGSLARGFLMTIYGLMSPRRKAQFRRALGVA